MFALFELLLNKIIEIQISINAQFLEGLDKIFSTDLFFVEILQKKKRKKAIRE